MSRTKSLFRKTVESVAVPWATHHGFTRASAHVFHRASHVHGLVEVMELQKSCKHPHRTFTVNLGLFHPAFTANPPPTEREIAAIHCARCVRIGNVMPKQFWSRVLLWLKHGTGWHFGQLFGGDFWWAYRDTGDSLTTALRDALFHVEQHGLPWFGHISSLRDTTEIFDRSKFTVYERTSFYCHPRNTPSNQP